MMSSLSDFSLPEAYKQISGTDILAGIDPLVDWNSLKPMVSSLYRNDTEKGGRPNMDEITMIRTLFIQELYGLHARIHGKGTLRPHILQALSQVSEQDA